MRKTATPIVLALVLALLAAGAGTASAKAIIAHDWSEAQALAEKHDKPILIDFFTEW